MFNDVVTDVDDEAISVPMPRMKKDKGKGKMKYLPELPQEVWQRVFELYYEDRHNEWHKTGHLGDGLAPLRICRQHTETALPILYRHPHISYHAIHPFISSVQLPSPYNDCPKQSYVKRFTIRPTHVVPYKRTPENSQGFTTQRPYTIHTSFPDLMGLIPHIVELTLKDTLLLYQPDATILFEGLRAVAPRKARIELRAWDLHDSPVGQSILLATRAGVHAPYNGRRSDLTESADNASPNDIAARHDQESWREALYNGTEFVYPLPWIDIRGADGQPLLLVPMPHLQPQQQQMTHQNIATAFGPMLPQHWPSLPPGTNQTQPQTGPPNVIHYVPALNPTAPVLYPNAYLSTGNAVPPTTFSSQSNLSTLNHQFNHRPSLSAWNHSITQVTSNGSDNLVSRARANHRNTTFINSAPARAQVEDDGDTSDTSSHVDDDDDMPAILAQIAESETAQAESSSSSLVHQSANSGPWGPSRSANTYTGSSFQQCSARQDRLRTAQLRMTHSNLLGGLQAHSNRVAPGLVSTSSLRAPFSSRTTGYYRPYIVTHAHFVDSSNNPVASMLDTGLTSVPLAHHIRGRLQDLITEVWTPNLEAFSFVAMDPLASLAVRAPRLDFWPHVAVRHIRVQLPQACNSLSIFKGPKEEMRARERAMGPLDHAAPNPNPALPSAISEEPQVVGGDGHGGALIHDDVRLFEVEINTVAEMRDDVWIRCGSQLPPQLCRILAGTHDWDNVGVGSSSTSQSFGPSPTYPAIPSPSTSQFDSPTFSFATLNSVEEMWLSDEEGEGDVVEEEKEGGSTYDAEAAAAQKRRLRARSSGGI